MLDESLKEKFPALILVPIAPKGMIWGYPALPRIFTAAPLAFDAIKDVRKKISINEDRIYISGYSMGGTGTFAMVENCPTLFAAALSLCGVWEPERAAFFPNDVPVLAVHGSEDNPASSKNMVDAINEAGKPGYYREYQGVGHNVWDYVYTDKKIRDWLFNQSRKN